MADGGGGDGELTVGDAGRPDTPGKEREREKFLCLGQNPSSLAAQTSQVERERERERVSGSSGILQTDTLAERERERDDSSLCQN